MVEENRIPPAVSGINLRDRLKDILGVDLWVETRIPAVAPRNSDEVIRLLQFYPGAITIVGSGTDFKEDYNPEQGVLLLLTIRLREVFEHSLSGWTLKISAGWDIGEVRRQLATEERYIPALEDFRQGTIGGRLAAISSNPKLWRNDGWAQSLLGLEVVTSDGELLVMGGRSIKDVAGYDIKHLFTGSRGVAGVIVSATFRTHPAGCGRESRVQHQFPKICYNSELKRLFDPKGRLRPGP